MSEVNKNAQIEFWESESAGSVPVEMFLVAQNEVEQREADLAELKNILDGLDLDEAQVGEIMTWAHGFWGLLNPLRGDESSLRFGFWRKRVNPDLRESNWQHSLLMLRKLRDLDEIGHDLLYELDLEKVIKMTLIHDAPEFLYGDMESLQQAEGDNLKVKKQRENRAAELISQRMDFGEYGADAGEFSQIFTEYEQRESTAAVLVKMLDIMSGDETFKKEVIQYLGQNPEQYQESELGLILDRNYEVNHRKRRASQQQLEEKLRAQFGLSADQEEAWFVNYGWQRELGAILKYVDEAPKQERNWREEILGKEGKWCHPSESN